MRAIGTTCLHPEEPKNVSTYDEAFTRIWQQHRAEVLGLCRRCTRQEADAEEAFSRTSLLLYRKLPAHQGQVENLRGWILRLTFNVCMSLHRENRRRGEQSLEEEGVENLAELHLLKSSPAEDPESRYLQKEMSQFLRGSIENLPLRLRETITGHLSLGNYREIAERLSIKEANARKRMQEAREILSRGLAEYRAGAAQPPVPARPEKPRQAASMNNAGEAPERARALRAVAMNLPEGVESEGLLTLCLPLAEESRQTLEGYVQDHPRGWKKRLALARTLLEEGCVGDALPHLESAVEKQPRHLAAWLDLIEIYRLQGPSNRAATACERALTANSGSATALLQGLRAECLGLNKEAEQAFLDAHKAMPESPAPWVALAKLQLATGQPSEACDSLEQALARSSNDVAALTLGSEALRLLGRSAEARRREARALELDGANPLALERSLMTEARKAGGRTAPEGPLWRAVERLARTRAESLSLLSFLRICAGDLAGAGEMAAFVAKRPQLPQARIARARLLDALDRPLSALQEIDAARTLQARSRDLDLFACRVSARAGLSWRTLQETEDLLARYGDAWDIASTAAWALAQLGRKDRAAELSQAVVERQPRLPVAWIEHGRVLTLCKRFQEAVAAIETCWSLLPEGDGFDLAAAAALDLAMLNRCLGLSERARHWTTQALGACTALAEFDAVRAHVSQARLQAGMGSEGAPQSPADMSPAFLAIEERRLLTTQTSEVSIA